MILKRYLLIHIVIFSLISGNSFSQTLEQTYSHALELFEQHDYTGSIAELRRVIFFDDSTYVMSYKVLGDCYKQLKNKEKALYYYKLAKNNCKNDSIAAMLKFDIVSVYLLHNEPNFALINLYAINTNNTEGFAVQKDFYTSLAFFLLHDYDNSQRYYNKILDSTDVRLSFQLDSLYTLAIKNERFDVRLPMYLSIVPGLGQLYLHENKAALNSFLLTSAFAGLYYVALSNLSLLDALLSVFPWFQRYYTGGMQQAKSMAIKKKRNTHTLIYNALIDLYVSENLNTP